MITRRRLVIALGAGALAPFASLAQQQSKIWRVGFLTTRHMEFVDADNQYGPFTQGMRELGYIVGKNLVIEWRSAEGKSERLPELAAELVRLKVDVLATAGTPARSSCRWKRYSHNRKTRSLNSRRSSGCRPYTGLVNS